MRFLGRCIAILCVVPTTLIASAQQRKPGLYDLTVQTTTLSPLARVYPPRTRQVCLTQQAIEKYGTFDPEAFYNICHLENVVRKPNGMTADMVCTVGLKGQGTLKADWSDGEHSKGSIHFSGTIQPGDAPIKIEWTATTTAVYKSPDCGDIKPAPTPPPSATPPPQ